MDMFHRCTCHRDEIPDQTTKQAPNQPGFVHTAQQSKSKFMLLNDFFKSKRLSHDTQILFGIQISVSIRKLLWNTGTLNHLCIIYGHRLWLFSRNNSRAE